MKIATEPMKSVILEEVRGLAPEMLILSRDGKYVINTAKKKVFVWDAETGALVAQKEVRYAVPYAAIIDAFGTQIIAYHSRDIVFISIPEVVETRRITNAHREKILTTRLCPDMKCFLSASRHEIKVWDLSGNLRWGIDDANIDIGYMAPAFDPESLLFAYSRKNSIVIHDISRGLRLHIDGCRPDIRPIAGEPSVISKKHNIVVSIFEESTVNIYSIAPPSCIVTIMFEQPLTAIRYDILSDRILICSATNRMLVIDPQTFAIRTVFVGTNSGIYDAVWVDNKLRVLYWREHNKKERYLVSDFRI